EDTSTPTVRGKNQLLGVEHAPVDHVLVIGRVGRHHHTPHRILSGAGAVLVFFVPQDEVVPALLTETACTSGAALRAGTTRLVLGEPLLRPVGPRCHGGSEFGGLRGRVRLQTQPTDIAEVGRGGIMPGGAAGHGSLLPESKDTAGVVRAVRRWHLLRGPVRRRPWCVPSRQLEARGRRRPGPIPGGRLLPPGRLGPCPWPREGSPTARFCRAVPLRDRSA